MKERQVCYRCAHGKHSFFGVQCDKHGVYFNDNVALQTSCKDWEKIE